LEPDAEDPFDVSGAIVEKARELGLQPFTAPPPLPLVDEDEAQLVCWMAVEGERV